MRWADIDFGAPTRAADGSIVQPRAKWSKPASSTKQKADHEVPLAPPARQLLAEIRERQAQQTPKRPLGQFVFPGAGGTGHVVEIKKGWRSLCRAAGITGLRLHDLRHSYASQLASSGASLPLIGALLGHSSPATTARYAHLFDDPMREATERVAAIVDAAGNPDSALPEPLPFKRRGA
jgi:integrase